MPTKSEREGARMLAHDLCLYDAHESVYAEDGTLALNSKGHTMHEACSNCARITAALEAAERLGSWHAYVRMQELITSLRIDEGLSVVPIAQIAAIVSYEERQARALLAHAPRTGEGS